MSLQCRQSTYQSAASSRRPVSSLRGGNISGALGDNAGKGEDTG